jgi:hypothetical protein
MMLAVVKLEGRAGNVRLQSIEVVWKRREFVLGGR